MLPFSKKILTKTVALSAFLLCACQTPPSPPPTENGSSIAIDYAVFLWKSENDFARISEYFTDEENQGSNCVARTNPDIREGLYLIVGIECGGTIPEGSTAMLEYFRPDKNSVQKAVFTLNAWTGTLGGELRLGLTGDAWVKGKTKARPNAWRLSVVDPDGKLLLYRESFLWEHPSQKSAEKKSKNGSVPAEKKPVGDDKKSANDAAVKNGEA